MTSDWQPSGRAAQEILAETIERFAPRAVLSCSFGGPGGMVLLHMLSQLPVKIPVLFLDTDFLFPETVQLKSAVAREYGLEVLTYRSALTPEQQSNAYGERLWESNPDQCCHLRKVEPMQRAIEDLQLGAWITALRRDQSETRRDIGTVQYQQLDSGRRLAKVYPLADWTRNDVWSYIIKNNVPYNPLLDQGYKSLGCVQCTAVSGSSERSGRWPGHQKTECGLHTFSS